MRFEPKGSSGDGTNVSAGVHVQDCVFVQVPCIGHYPFSELDVQGCQYPQNA